MLNKAFSKKKRWITSAIAGTVAVAVITVGLYNSSDVALAKASLPKIEEFNQENGLGNPFTILEIVPSYDRARIGYLVNGQEPAYYDENGVKALADMGSAAEREDRYPGNSGAFATEHHDFAAFTEFNVESGNKPFSYNDYDEKGENRPKSFSVYGSFVEVGASGGDYIDNRDVNDTYERITLDGVTLADVLKTTDDRTSHGIYSDDVIFDFQTTPMQGGGYNLTFQRYESALRYERIPFMIDVEGRNYSNWYYYLLGERRPLGVQTLPVTAPETGSGEGENGETTPEGGTDNPLPTEIYHVDATFSQESVTGLYLNYNKDQYRYYGYITYNSDLKKYFFTSAIDANDVVPVDGDDVNTDSLAMRIMLEDLELNTIRHYSEENDTDLKGERLFLISAEDNTAGTAVVSRTLANKTLRMSAGDDPALHYIDLNDDLTYHEFYYLPSSIDEFVYYLDENGQHSQPLKGTRNFVSDFKKDVLDTFDYKDGFDNNEWFKQYVLDLVKGDSAPVSSDEENNETTSGNQNDVTTDQCADYVIDVITKTPDEVTLEDIKNAKLIYIQGPDNRNTDAESIKGKYTSDFVDGVAEGLLKEIGENNKPVIIEGKSLYDGVAADYQNLRKLTTVLLMPDFYSHVEDAITNWMIPTWMGHAVEIGTMQSGEANVNKPYVNGSLFVVNGNNGGCAIGLDFTTPFTDDILQGITYTLNIAGSDVEYKLDYSDVIADIEKEQFYLEVANKQDVYFNDEISIATCIRHILNYGERRTITKTSLRVLDIEPYYSEVLEENARTVTDYRDIYFNKLNVKTANGFADMVDGNKRATNNYYDPTSRDIFDKEWFIASKLTHIENKDAIDVKGMGTREFIGSIEDLSSKYDLIYIGLDTQYMNTRIDTRADGTPIKSTYTIYNDENMNGLVYTHIGDTFQVLREVDYQYGATMYDSGAQTSRGSGTDITYEKLRDLICYVEAGYAVMLSDEFYTYNDDGSINSVNDAKIARQSYMHDFAQWVYEKGYVGKNVVVKHDLVYDSDYPKSTEKKDTVLDDGKVNEAYLLNNRDSFAEYLSISKLSVEVLKDAEGKEMIPVPYFIAASNGNDDSGTGAGMNGSYQYLKMNADGVYTLDFRVKLTDDAAANRGDTTYNCKLYIDHDADGRFEAVEAINGLIITEVGTGIAASMNEKGDFALSAGSTYDITRRVPEGYVGFLPWKLVFYENGRVFEDVSNESEQTLVRTSIQGYSAVPDYSNRPKIKILQIASSPQNAWNRDNTEAMVTLNLRDDAELKELYKQVKDFEIDVTLVNTYQIINNVSVDNNKAQLYDEGKMLDYLMDFDMVVMGFFDDYNFANTNFGANADAAPMNEFMYNIREYILSGKSMLFTHDLTNTNLTINNNELGKYYPDNYLRDLQGMDRYGVTRNGLATLATAVGKTLTPYLSRYDDDRYNDIFGFQSAKSTYAASDSSSVLIDTLSLVVGQMLRFHFDTGVAIEFAENCFAATNGLKPFISWGPRNGGMTPAEYNAAVQADKYIFASESEWGPWSPMGPENMKEGNKYYYYTFEKTGEEFVSDTVTRVNQGQITEYPFKIAEEVNVAPTHPQYYQLNLDTDSQDENYDDDIVVWYTISNQDMEHVGFYTVDYNDTRNNYYIYNKGNITYTGAGHSPVTGTEEKKLFVNTLVAAYNAGDHAPIAKYRQYPREMANDITAIYEPFDVNLRNNTGAETGGFVEDNIIVHFKTINNNLQNNVMLDTNGNLVYKRINAEYYVEAKEGETGAIKIGDSYYRKIVPTSLQKIVNSNGFTLEQPETLTYMNNLENYTIYTAKFALSDLLPNYQNDKNGDKLYLRNHNTKVYIRLSMDTEVADMAKPLEVLPATDSMCPLAVNFTELYELK